MTTDLADADRAPRAADWSMSRSCAAGIRGRIDRFVPRRVQGQLVRFAVVGVASTAAYGVLYLVLRIWLGPFLANALALLLTAIANTAVNRRVTFGVRGQSGLAGDHAVGLIAFGVGLALTSGSLAVLDAAGNAGHGAELVVLTIANAVATLLRFVALKLRVGTAS